MTQLNEAKLGRVWKLITDSNYSFAIISAYRGNYSLEENKSRHNKLKSFVRENGYGFVELRGGYSEINPDTQEQSPISYEDSVLITTNSSNSDKLKKIALMLGEQLEQDSIIFKDEDEFSLIGTNESTGIGSVLLSFSTVDNNNINTEAHELFKSFFSTLKKGSNKGRKFVFNLQERQSVDSVNRAYLKQAGKFTEHWNDVRFK